VGTKAEFNHGAHGFSEIVYQFTSSSANNGSGFEGLGDTWGFNDNLSPAPESRPLQANILAKSGKAVETAGDIDVVLLDKTGTITMGNRHATDFLPVGKYNVQQLGRLAAIASIADETPEGKTIVKLHFDRGGTPVDVTAPNARNSSRSRRKRA
jgi:hypothetical protein